MHDRGTGNTRDRRRLPPADCLARPRPRPPGGGEGPRARRPERDRGLRVSAACHLPPRRDPPRRRLIPVARLRAGAPPRPRRSPPRLGRPRRAARGRRRPARAARPRAGSAGPCFARARRGPTTSATRAAAGCRRAPARRDDVKAGVRWADRHEFGSGALRRRLLRQGTDAIFEGVVDDLDRVRAGADASADAPGGARRSRAGAAGRRPRPRMASSSRRRSGRRSAPRVVRRGGPPSARRPGRHARRRLHDGVRPHPVVAEVVGPRRARAKHRPADLAREVAQRARAGAAGAARGRDRPVARGLRRGLGGAQRERATGDQQLSAGQRHGRRVAGRAARSPRSRLGAQPHEALRRRPEGVGKAAIAVVRSSTSISICPVPRSCTSTSPMSSKSANLWLRDLGGSAATVLARGRSGAAAARRRGSAGSATPPRSAPSSRRTAPCRPAAPAGSARASRPAAPPPPRGQCRPWKRSSQACTCGTRSTTASA